MPDTSSPVSTPLTSRTSIPSQQRITRTRLSTNPTTLQFSKMTLEESNLMFSVDAGWVGLSMHDAEMIVDLSATNRSCGLRNQLGTTHSLSIPIGGFIKGDLGTKSRSGIGWVLVAAIKGNIFGDVT